MTCYSLLCLVHNVRLFFFSFRMTLPFVYSKFMHFFRVKCMIAFIFTEYILHFVIDVTETLKIMALSFLLSLRIIIQGTSHGF